MQTCYLLHFERPISDRHTTQHYLGWTDNLESRVNQHKSGAGSRLCQVAKDREIPFEVVRTWPGDRGLERKLKNRHASNRLCPICNPKVNPE